jgi:hypothetical protein
MNKKGGVLPFSECGGYYDTCGHLDFELPRLLPYSYPAGWFTKPYLFLGLSLGMAFPYLVHVLAHDSSYLVRVHLFSSP